MCVYVCGSSCVHPVCCVRAFVCSMKYKTKFCTGHTGQNGACMHFAMCQTTHSYAPLSGHTHTHPPTHTRTHARTRTHTHTHTHTYMHARTHTDLGNIQALVTRGKRPSVAHPVCFFGVGKSNFRVGARALRGECVRIVCTPDVTISRRPNNKKKNTLMSGAELLFSNA